MSGYLEGYVGVLRGICWGIARDMSGYLEGYVGVLREIC